MHVQFWEYLAGPGTRKHLPLEATKRTGDAIKAGVRKSPRGSYPIVNGVPRFAGYDANNCAEIFAWLWHKWPRVQKPDVPSLLFDTFDSVTPSRQSAHANHEILPWYKKRGFVEVEPTDRGFTSARGIKPETEEGKRNR